MTPSQPIYTRTLSHAVRLVGGDQRFAVLLGTTSVQVGEWLSGARHIPDDVFLRAVDLLMEEDARRLAGAATFPTLTAR